MQIGLVELEVQGSIPEWLEGDFYRTGPGLTGGYVHWFDGLGMLVNFRFSKNGRVSWQQRFLDTADYRMYREAGNQPQLTAFKFSPGAFKSIIDAMKDLLGLGHGACMLLLALWMVPMQQFLSFRLVVPDLLFFVVLAAGHRFVFVDRVTDADRSKHSHAAGASCSLQYSIMSLDVDDGALVAHACLIIKAPCNL
jgi:hypothetical protein